MKKNNKLGKLSRGFTLIELLVVIAIIGILSSVIVASLSTARDKANDAKRRSDMTELRTALELYHSNHNSYPSTNEKWCAISNANPTCNTPDWIPGLVLDGDISSLPQDPAYPNASNNTNSHCTGLPSEYYYASGNGTGYLLLDNCPSSSGVVSTSLSDPFFNLARQGYAWMLCVTGNDTNFPECSQ